MSYDHKSFDKKWQDYWKEKKTFQADNESEKDKYYVLDMFPYPSGAGLHVGHPLGYIASDILARYKRLKCFNVLHPMGFDSFGLPAEQYAIQTGQHPAITTKENIARYREQLESLGFSFDWSREVQTSDPKYYKWTQWIFLKLFESYYDTAKNKAQPISELIQEFEVRGNENVKAHTSYEKAFSADEWKSFSDKEKSDILLEYRLTYLADTVVNWCPDLGTVLANDEVKDGFSERGGYPVFQKKMRQWMMRITAYADRLESGLEKLDWSESIKDMQRNWIGKSKGASIYFSVEGTEDKIEIFTTRPDTIFGASFMVLAPEHELVSKITSANQKKSVDKYIENASRKTERERMAEAKTVSGVFTGSYAIHPFTRDKIEIWIADYVLAGYGTGAIMAVPSGDQRDWNFAKKFNLPIPVIIEGSEIDEGANENKDGVLINSDFLNGMKVQQAIEAMISKLEELKIGTGKINYKLRDAVFSRQRYWGEPVPIYFVDDIPCAMKESDLPLELPEVDKYLPTSEGEPPLARAENWRTNDGHPIETNTMPGWAGSSWYFFRYMDSSNENEPFSAKAAKYWNNVDFYVGGAEHATGHLLYARFWTKFLFDIGLSPVKEPFQKMMNQGMIQGNSRFVHKLKSENTFVSAELSEEYDTIKIHVDVALVDGIVLNTEGFRAWRTEYGKAKFIMKDEFQCAAEVEKMSKSKFNVVNPDELIDMYGADTLRCYEMFLGPVEQHKPWDTKGIEGVYRFLRKFWNLFHNENQFSVSEDDSSDEAKKALHKFLKKVEDDLKRLSFNTVVSECMILTNQLQELKCNHRDILEPFVIAISPYAPHTAEELWNKLGHSNSVSAEKFPEFKEEYLVENSVKYPVSFNGKTRFTLECAADLSKEEVEKLVLQDEQSTRWLDGKSPKKVIVVPGRIVNVVV
jgi:leucyl-tRNA synthetase